MLRTPVFHCRGPGCLVPCWGLRSYKPQVLWHSPHPSKTKAVMDKYDVYWGFPGDAVVKNPPASAGDTGSTLGWEDPLEKGNEAPGSAELTLPASSECLRGASVRSVSALSFLSLPFL